MPHLIISGMPGIGKTTSVLCLARQLLGDSYKEAVLELNASDERGAFQTPLPPRSHTLTETTQVSKSSGNESRASPRKKLRFPQGGTRL
jgi:DNA polymerase III delta prime subunit